MVAAIITHRQAVQVAETPTVLAQQELRGRHGKVMMEELPMVIMLAVAEEEPVNKARTD